MAKSSSDIFEEMQKREFGWTYWDFRTLYEGYGFGRVQGRKYDIYSHPQLFLWQASIPNDNRERILPASYAKDAIRAIKIVLNIGTERNAGNER